MTLRWLAVLLICAAVPSVAHCECQVIPEKEDLQPRVLQLWGNLHLPDVVPLPPTKDGEPRFSVLRFLDYLGVPLDAGAEAIWLPKSNVAVLTMSAESFRKAEQSLSPTCFSLKGIQLTLGIWEYEHEQPALGALPPTRLRALKEVAGNSLRLLHSHTILTSSGNIAIAVSRIGDSKVVNEGRKTADGDAKVELQGRQPLRGDHGSSIEVEAVTGPDGFSFDLRAAYEFRVASTIPGAEIDLSGDTNIQIVQGNDVVVRTGTLRAVDPGAPSGKPRHYALVIGGRIVGEGDQESLKLKVKFDEELRSKEKEIIERAREGLDVQNQTNP